jgi:hypothetical protein
VERGLPAVNRHETDVIPYTLPLWDRTVFDDHPRIEGSCRDGPMYIGVDDALEKHSEALAAASPQKLRATLGNPPPEPSRDIASP